LVSTVSIDVRALELFLKKYQRGPDVVEALRYRTAIHWLNPELDRLSSRMIPAYEKLCELVEWPFNLLDAGCMTGYLKHFMLQRVKPFVYVGMDSWEEALTVAKEFDPLIEVHQKDILNDPIEGQWDYVWCSNIRWEDPKQIVDKLVPLATRACFFAQPPWTGDFASLEWDEVIDCNETTLYVKRK
jgi:SAM-dependent methyltransferase